MNINIEDYLPLVKSLVSKYPSSIVSNDDLIQEGTIGLLEASMRFDPSKDVEFGVYAKFWVRKRILAALETEQKATQNINSINTDFIKETKNESYTNSTKNDKIIIPESFPKNEKLILDFIFNEEFSLSEIAEKINITRERVRQLKEKALRRLRIYMSKNES